MKVKILRNTIADRRPVFAGDIEDISEADARLLINMSPPKAAVVPAADPVAEASAADQRKAEAAAESKKQAAVALVQQEIDEAGAALDTAVIEMDEAVDAVKAFTEVNDKKAIKAATRTEKAAAENLAAMTLVLETTRAKLPVQ